MRLAITVLTTTLLGLAGPALGQDHDGAQTGTEQPIAVLHAIGAQIYECRKSDLDTLTWVLREPVAILRRDGKGIGRHSAGPTWELADGTKLKATPRSQTPAANPADIPNLLLEITEATGPDPIASAHTIRRINTSGGVAKGGCLGIGDVMAVPYSADYAFYGAHALD